jgi:uncharacterized membrane protein YuzA (DUF378 family)
MDYLNRFAPIALLLMFLGALNWGIFGITGGSTNVLAEIFGTGTLADIVYVVIGVAALAYVPKLLDELHIGHGAHPRGV